MSGAGVDEGPSWLHLSEDESIVWQARPHPVAMGVGAAIGLGVLVVGVALITLGTMDGPGLAAWIGLVVAVVGTGFVGLRYAFWTNTRYVITTDELYEKRGVVTRDVTQFRLDRVQNTRLEQSVAGRALGYADITVYTAGSGDPELTFTYVPNPGGANAAISDRLGDAIDSNRSGRP